MDDSPGIHDNEILLRRIPPGNTIAREEGGDRPESWRLQPRQREDGASCHRLAFASPQNVLNDLERQGHDTAGWTICAIRVADVRAVGLDVVVVEHGNLPGHCEIRPPVGANVGKKAFSKLAKKCRILTSEEVSCMNAGDSIDI